MAIIMFQNIQPNIVRMTEYLNDESGNESKAKYIWKPHSTGVIMTRGLMRDIQYITEYVKIFPHETKRCLLK